MRSSRVNALGFAGCCSLPSPRLRRKAATKTKQARWLCPSAALLTKAGGASVLAGGPSHTDPRPREGAPSSKSLNSVPASHRKDRLPAIVVPLTLVGSDFSIAQQPTRGSYFCLPSEVTGSRRGVPGLGSRCSWKGACGWSRESWEAWGRGLSHCRKAPQRQS